MPSPGARPVPGARCCPSLVMARNRDEVGGGVGGGLNQAWGNAPQTIQSTFPEPKSTPQELWSAKTRTLRVATQGNLHWHVAPSSGIPGEIHDNLELGLSSPTHHPHRRAPARNLLRAGPVQSRLPAPSQEPRDPWAPRDPVGCPACVLRDTGLPQESGSSVPTEPSSVPLLPPDQAWALKAPG